MKSDVQMAAIAAVAVVIICFLLTDCEKTTGVVFPPATTIIQQKDSK